jgi:anthranilate phosphoribosyltransferase
LTDADALKHAIHRVADGSTLTFDEARGAFGVLMRGESSPLAAAALLFGLRARGETADELAGAAVALRDAMIRIHARDVMHLVDTCGTGGGRVTTLNISTAAAFVVAGAGIPVAKHGNRSFTSRSGSADVLESLGIDIGVGPERATRLLDDDGLAFLFAPTYHPAMRHVAPARRELGVPTIMNLLGPLVNPAGARRQVIGVADRARAALVAAALVRLEAGHAIVVHAEVGMDEVSPSGLTHAWEVESGAVREWVIDPADVGMQDDDLGALAGGEPAENARRIEALFRGGGHSAERAAVVLNAAAAIHVSVGAGDFRDSVRRAAASLDGGSARAALAKLRAAAPRH